MIEELNKKRPKKEISNTEKNIIKSLFDKDCSIDNLLNTLAIDKNPDKADSVINYYKSLQKPLKPIPKNLTKLFVKTSGEVLPCFHYPSKQIPGKRYYTLLVMDEKVQGKQHYLMHLLIIWLELIMKMNGDINLLMKTILKIDQVEKVKPMK